MVGASGWCGLGQGVLEGRCVQDLRQMQLDAADQQPPGRNVTEAGNQLGRKTKAATALLPTQLAGAGVEGKPVQDVHPPARLGWSTLSSQVWQIQPWGCLQGLGAISDGPR